MVLTIGGIILGGLALATGLTGTYYLMKPTLEELGKEFGESLENVKDNIRDVVKPQTEAPAIETPQTEAPVIEQPQEEKEQAIEQKPIGIKPTMPLPKPGIGVGILQQIQNGNSPLIPGQQGQKDPIPNINGNEQQIQDKTDENEEISIGGIDIQSYLDQARALRQEQWDREDAIRKETQEREDTAYQRAIADMKKAGINPNLMNVTPAESGGGITQASGLNMTIYENEMQKYMLELEQAFEESFQGDENQKDRFMKALQNIITLVGIFGMARK